MVGWLNYTVIVIAVIAVVWGIVAAATKKPPGNAQFYWSFLTELAVVVQSMVGFVAIARGAGPAETATAIGYLIGIVLLMPLGIWWAIVDRSRYSGLVMTIAAAAIAVMTLRLQQIWGM